MNKEAAALINICRSYLSGEKLCLADDIDYKEFYHIAKNHNLIGICHCVFSADKELSVPDNIRHLFEDKFFDLVYIYNCQSIALADIEQCFASENIPFVVFKGAVLRELYPVPESRSMGDIDILIDKSDRDRAKAALKTIGFDCYAPNGAVREYSRDGFILEVHTSIISELGDSAFADAFDNADFNGLRGRLGDNYHFAYLIAHIAHHFKFYGAGIKMILDLAVMLKKCDIDIDLVLELLRPLKLETFAKEILSVTCEWFSLGVSYNSNTDRTQEYLASCGAFGTLADNKGAIIARRDLEQGKKGGKLVTKLRLAFPSYDKMKNIPYIKFIEGRPWLTPYAWIYRFIYNFKYRKDFTKKTIHSIDDTAEALAMDELRYFEEIGLV